MLILAKQSAKPYCSRTAYKRARSTPYHAAECFPCPFLLSVLRYEDALISVPYRNLATKASTVSAQGSIEAMQEAPVLPRAAMNTCAMPRSTSICRLFVPKPPQFRDTTIPHRNDSALLTSRRHNLFLYFSLIALNRNMQYLQYAQSPVITTTTSIRIAPSMVLVARYRLTYLYSNPAVHPI